MVKGYDSLHKGRYKRTPFEEKGIGLEPISIRTHPKEQRPAMQESNSIKSVLPKLQQQIDIYITCNNSIFYKYNGMNSTINNCCVIM